MKIHNPKTKEVMVNQCRGSCYCHSMPVQFGDDKNVCGNCGCPKTEQGWETTKVRFPIFPSDETAEAFIESKRIPVQT